MYAPRQHRPEKKKPYSNFLALEQAEHEGPIMAPPVFSATGEIKESDEEEAKEGQKKSTPAVEAATEQNAVQNNATQRQEEKEGGASESEASTATHSAVKKPVGRSENPPQFKLKAGAPFQFKFANAPLQMKPGSSMGGGGSSSGGSGLPDGVKSQMEGSFGTSFDDVRVTANSSMAKEAGALAFAQGSNIHFAPGQYNPSSKGGQELLGHELTHVVQQREGRVQANAEVNGLAVNNDKGLESEADQMGAKAAQFKAAPIAPVQKSASTGSGAGALQMKMDPNTKETKQEERLEDEKEEQDTHRTEVDDEFGMLDDQLALDGFKERPTEEKEGEEGQNDEGDAEKKEAIATGNTEENTEIEGEEREDEEETEDRGGSPDSENASGESEEEQGETEAEAKDDLEDKAEEEEPESEEAEDVKEEVEAKDGGDEAKAEGGGVAGDGGAGEAAGGGAGEGAGAGGGGAGEGGGGGGNASPSAGNEPIVVQQPVRGNFGEGDEPDLMVVSEGAIGEFDSKRIIKDNGDGTYIVVAGTPAVSDPSSTGLPIQMAEDPTKAKPIKKKLSKAQGNMMFAANREKTKGFLAEFEAQAKSKIATLESVKSSISGQVNAGADAAKSVILSAAAAEKARVEGAFEAQKSALLADAERVKGETRAQMETAIGLVQTGAETARTNVEAEFTAQDAAFVALEPVQKEKFTAAFDKGKADMIKAAEELGKLAIEKGEVRAKEYEAMPIPEQSWDEELLNGGDYEKDRHNARVKAARDVAKSYADQFMQKAQEEGAKLKGSGEAELHKYVTDSIVASRDGISQRKQAAFDQITAQETGAIDALRTNCEATIAGIDSAAQGGLTALDQQKGQAIGQIDTTAQGKVQAVDAVAQEKVANLEDQVQSSIDALTNQMNQTITGVSARKNPNAVTVQRQLQAALNGIQSGVDTSMATIDGGILASVDGLNSTANESATELNTAATAAIDGGQQMKTSITTSLEAQRDSFQTGSTSIADTTSTAMAQGAEQAAKDMQDQYKAVTTDFDGALGGLTGKMTENSAAFRSNIQQQLDGLDAKITEEAQKAYDAVQPRWVSWLLTAIDILVMIIITAVVLIAVASGVGILGLLLIGAVAGAIGGAIKYGARCGLTSEEASWKGLGMAVVEGAVDGLNIAVGCIPGVGVLAQVGMGALGGAIKYGADCLINGKEFSWSALGGKVFLGGLEGAMGAIGGKAGDGVSNFLTKKIGAEAMEKIGNKIIVDVAKTGTEAMFDTVNGGLQNMFEHYFTTGTLDFGKFTEKLTFKEFATNFATSKVVDFAAGKISDGVVDHYGLKPNTPTTGDGDGSTSTNGSQTTTNEGGDATTTNTSNKTTNDGGDANNTPVNNNQTTNGDSNNTPTNNNTTADPQNNTTSGDGNNKQSNTDPQNNTSETPTLVPPVQNGPDTKNGETTNTPDPSKTKGQQQAEAKGYPEAPHGYEWVAKADGTPYLRRQSGRAADLPQVKFDPATGQFTPTTNAPDGYHWKYENGAFTVHPDPANADSLPPMQYDPTTGGFKTADGPYNGDITTLPVRGQNFDGFVATVDGLGAKPEVAKQAYELFAKKDWAGLEALFKAEGINGGWPPNRGFIDIKDGVLPVGSSFDRFGGYTDDGGNFQDKGTFVAPYGADFDGRALPDSTKSKPLNGYEVLKPIPMKEGQAIPWFGKPGNGTQYELPMSINDLIAGGYIKKIDAPDLSKPAGDGTANTSTNNTTTPDANTTTPDANNTTPDPTKDNGDGSGDGGGMKSKTAKGEQVYTPTDGSPNINSMPLGNVTQALVNAVPPGTLLHGATITRVPDTTVTMTMNVNGMDVKVSLVKEKNKKYDGNKKNTSHGESTGPAYNTVKWVVGPDGVGRWEATIVVNENYDAADLDKMAVHEFNEIADIVVKESANKDSGKYDDGSGNLDTKALENSIKEQQKASVFAEGVSATDVDVTKMTAHDHAVVKELSTVMGDLETAINNEPTTTTAKAEEAKIRTSRDEIRRLEDESKADATKKPANDLLVAAENAKIAASQADLAKFAETQRQKERVRILMETMGIKHTGDAGYKLLVDQLGLTLPPAVQTYFDLHIGSDADNQMMKNVLQNHVKTSDFDGTFVKGCHDEAMFMQHVADGNIQIITSTPSGTPGVTNHQYHPIVNGAPDTDTVGLKTTYDPAVWTDARLAQSATEAWKDPNKTFFNMPPLGIRSWRGKDSNGNTIVGHVMPDGTDSNVTTFWPE